MVRAPQPNEQLPVNRDELPAHVAVIMDGNGRWARERGMPRVAGHRKGVERVRELVNACGELGIGFLTVFAFSSENWRRPAQEVSMLMELFMNALDREISKLHENGVRFQVIGDVDRFPADLVARIRRAESLTAGNSGLRFTVAANYGGRWDLTQACQAIGRLVAQGQLDPEMIDDAVLEEHLSTAGMPAPDLFIRTGGEQRISNFLLWPLAYTELYFTPVWWPDFSASQFQQALGAYAARQRRFGLTGDQVDAARHA